MGKSNLCVNETNIEFNVIENSFNQDKYTVNQTLFAQANGYIGFRGSFEEGTGDKNIGIDGTFINGFFESEEIKYPESAYAFAKRSQTMLNVCNSKIIKIWIEGEAFNLTIGDIYQYERIFSLNEGIVKRELIWRSPSGNEIKVKTERIVSLTNKNLAVISYSVTPLNFSGNIKITSIIDGNVSNITTEDDPRVGSSLKGRVLSIEDKQIEGHLGTMVQKTKFSDQWVGCCMSNIIDSKVKYNVSGNVCDNEIQITFDFDAQKDSEINIKKYITYVTSKGRTDLLSITKEKVEEAIKYGYDSIKNDHTQYIKNFWHLSSIKIKGDPLLSQGLNFNMFHLLQSVGKDGYTNISAKGLTGEGYEGHYFWDTEIYVLPFFLSNMPQIAKKLLEYRYNTLDIARERARQMAHEKGALFAWRTIDGEECSAYFPAGTAQYHINADIAFGIKKYIESTNDEDFLKEFGAEMLFETARLWLDLGFFNKNKDEKFCINTVTGPDEYTAIVNNNCYTNLMAQVNLEYAYKVAKWLKEEDINSYNSIVLKIQLKEQEIDFWKKASDNMYIPFDKERNLYLQDDEFLNKKVWDFKNTPKEKYPLLTNYHPLVIYRHQVCKQADLILAMYLLGDKFTKEEKRKNYEYYEPITTHDSSLSNCIFGIIASEIEKSKEAYEFFIEGARMDLDDTHKNTKDGIHVANMAGTWMSVVSGFGGMRVFEGVLHFNPVLPENWESYSFRVLHQKRLIEVSVGKNNTEYKLLEGDSIVIIANGKERRL